MPYSTITLFLNCFKVPLIQKYRKTINHGNHCIFKPTWPKFGNIIFYLHISGRHTVQKFCFSSWRDIHSKCAIDKSLSFWRIFVFSWLLLLVQGMAPISSLTWHLKKCGKGGSCHNCLDLFCVHLHCQCFVFGFSSRNIQ